MHLHVFMCALAGMYLLKQSIFPAMPLNICSWIQLQAPAQIPYHNNLLSHSVSVEKPSVVPFEEKKGSRTLVLLLQINQLKHQVIT